MASSTFKGRYEECDECIYQFYDKDKNYAKSEQFLKLIKKRLGDTRL